MIASDEVLERMQADGKISTHDADEVRNFQSFLEATAGIPRAAEHRTPEQQHAFAVAYSEHYPESAAEMCPCKPGAPEHVHLAGGYAR